MVRSFTGTGGAMISLHHTHLMASDLDTTIIVWREHFGAEVAFDADFAGARHVFMRVGQGRLHLYAQPQGLADIGYFGTVTRA